MSRSGRALRFAFVLIGAVLLDGCGIDQGGVAVTGGAATDRTVLVSGPITGFGSVLVNGLRLDTSTAQILVDGRFAAEADLRMGQVIRAVATATDDGYRALSIEFDENLVGPIERLDAAAGTLTVLEQTVTIDAETHFEPPLAGAGDLAPGVEIAVSGLPLPSGQIRGTFVRRADSMDTFELTGSITAVDAPGFTFEIGSLRVDYSEALLLQLPMGTPAVGQIVAVRGTTLTQGTLTATEVSERSSLPGLLTAAAISLTDFEASLAGAPVTSAALDVNFVGYLSATDLPTSISVGDINVALSKDTVVAGGRIADLSAGGRVRVEGTVLSFGRIQAQRIELL